MEPLMCKESCVAPSFSERCSPRIRWNVFQAYWGESALKFQLSRLNIYIENHNDYSKVPEGLTVLDI